MRSLDSKEKGIFEAIILQTLNVLEISKKWRGLWLKGNWGGEEVVSHLAKLIGLTRPVPYKNFSYADKRGCYDEEIEGVYSRKIKTRIDGFGQDVIVVVNFVVSKVKIRPGEHYSSLEIIFTTESVFFFDQEDKIYKNLRPLIRQCSGLKFGVKNKAILRYVQEASNEIDEKRVVAS